MNRFAITFLLFLAGSIVPPVLQAQSHVATGTFDVTLTPRAADSAGSERVGRMSMAKRFHGGIEGVGTGEMLTAMSPVEGSAGYVAMEEISGTLDGRRGSFVLQHSGTMNRGAPTLVISVVPDSGTDELAGLTGTMTVTVTEGEHRYEFRYELQPAEAGGADE